MYLDKIWVPLILGLCSVQGVPRPTCPKYPSCTWAQQVDTKLCSGVDEELPCPLGHPLCPNHHVSPPPSGGSLSCCCLTPNPALKHLNQGDPKPALQEGKLRLYFMRFCPDSHRVALIAAAKHIQTDVVFVDLRNNPDWFTENSKLGRSVPAVETNLGSFNDSLIVADFLDETYPNPGEMYPCNTVLKAVDKMLIQNFNKDTPPLFSAAVKNSTAIQAFEDKLWLLGNELARRETPFFGGNKPGMFDYMIWPWIERKPVLKLLHPNAAIYNHNRTDSRLAKWTEMMKKDKAVISFGLAPEVYSTFYQSIAFTNDKNPSYDILA